MSYSKFFSSLWLLIVLNAAIKPVWIFGIDRQVQNITGVAEYGNYFALFNLSIVFGFLLDWGLNTFINRELAARRSELKDRLSSFLLLKLIFFGLYLCVVVGVGWLSGITHWRILLGVVVIQFLTFLFLFLRNVVTANQWFRTDAWLSVLDKTLMIVVCGVFILFPAVFGMINIERFITAQIACTAAATLIVTFILVSRGISFRKPSLRFLNRTFIASILPFAITIFLMSVHIRLDGFFLERLHRNGAYEAGLYAGAYRLLDASNMVGYLIASFFMPFVARLWSEKQPLGPVILQTRHLQLAFATTVSAIVVMLAPALQRILYHRVDLYGFRILQWCLPALVGYGLTQVYGTVMTATGNIISFCWLNLAAVIINVVLNLCLIPHYGALACCIAALCSQSFLGIATMVFVHRRFRTSPGLESLALYIANGGLVMVSLFLAMRFTGNLFVLLAIAMFTSFIFMWLNKLIPPGNGFYFIKKQ